MWCAWTGPSCSIAGPWCAARARPPCRPTRCTWTSRAASRTCPPSTPTRPMAQVCRPERATDAGATSRSLARTLPLSCVRWTRCAVFASALFPPRLAPALSPLPRTRGWAFRLSSGAGTCPVGSERGKKVTPMHVHGRLGLKSTSVNCAALGHTEVFPNNGTILLRYRGGCLVFGVCSGDADARSQWWGDALAAGAGQRSLVAGARHPRARGGPGAAVRGGAYKQPSQHRTHISLHA